LDKKEKKELIRLRNRKVQMIQRHAVQHQDARDAVYDAQAAVLEAQHAVALAAESAPAEAPWTARTREITNRLNGHKRNSNDLWNRFAGTESGGGRGR
jgi:uncharacterized membrane protein YcjF (UPF0283 family)